ncbi:MAG: thioredoxin [Deltaproteobacteria bacterium]|nr:thioredoxin [Deltaproteobacteria bacterium]
MGKMLDVTDRSFDEEVLKAALPTVIDFWAEWCAPCRQIKPILEELAQRYDGKVKIVKLNVDENPQTMTKYGVRAIPTLLAFKNGVVVQQVQGARPKAFFEQMLDGLIA